MLQNIPTVINGVRCGGAVAVARALEIISQSIQDMIDSLKLMHGNILIHTETHTHRQTHRQRHAPLYLSITQRLSLTLSQILMFSSLLVYVKPTVFYGIMRIFLSGYSILFLYHNYIKMNVHLEETVWF